MSNNVASAEHLYRFKLKNTKTNQIGWLDVTDAKDFIFRLSHKKDCSGFVDKEDKIVKVVEKKLAEKYPDYTIIKVDKNFVLLFDK